MKLVYIDPPFETGNTYERNGISAYSSKRGTEYLEWLRKRIILLKYLLTDDDPLRKDRLPLRSLYKGAT